MSNINKKNITVNNNSIGITTQNVNDIITYVENNNKEKVISLLNKIHPADAADLLEMLSEEYRKKVILILSHKFPAEILPSMNVPILISIIEYFNLLCSFLFNVLIKISLKVLFGSPQIITIDLFFIDF